MVIYVDILFVLNLIVNFYLLLFTGRLGGESPRFLRLFFSSFFSAGAAFTIFLPDFGFLFSLLLRLMISVITVFLCFGARTAKRFFRLFATFFTVTFAFAGFMLALWHLLNIESMVIRNGVVYYDLSPVLLIVSTAAAYLILTLIRRLMRRNAGNGGGTYAVTVGFCGMEARFQALLDTGNALTDPFSDAPVIIAEYALVAGLIPACAREAYAVGGIGTIPAGMEERHRLIPFTSVGGRGMLPGFTLDFAEIVVPGFGRTDRAVIAVSPSPLGGEHRALIGNGLLEYCSGQSGSLRYTVAKEEATQPQTNKSGMKLLK